MAEFWVPAGVVFVELLLGEVIIAALLRLFGVYSIVEERTCHVYVLFGRVVGIPYRALADQRAEAFFVSRVISTGIAGNRRVFRY